MRHFITGLTGVLVFLAGCSTTPIEPATPPAAPSVQSPAVSLPATPLQPQAETTTPSELVSPPLRRLSVAAVGDIMLGTDYPTNRLPEQDGVELLKPVIELLKSADVTFGNLEGTLLDGGQPRKACKNPQTCYLFRTPTRYVQRLLEAGFTVMSLANNHARDFGEVGRTSSMQVLANAGIRHSGREQDIASWELPHNGLQVALIAYAPFGGAYDPRDLEQVRDTIAELASRHDVVIVSMHMGAEGEVARRIPFKTEFFHGEDRGDVVAFARTAIDAGADLVLGHGPHVPRAVELYRDRLIAYSLGNFCTYYGINVNGINGLAPILKVELAEDGRFLSGRIISARQQRPFGPILDSDHTAARLIAELTQLDFPNSELVFRANGEIQRKPAQTLDASGADLTEKHRSTRPVHDKPGVAR